MALRNEEILRLKYELGYNITGVGADVYITYSAVFDRAVQPYLVDPETTSATAVLAGAGSTTIAIAANPLGPIAANQPLSFVVGSGLVIDIGAAQEISIITAISGLNITLSLVNAHTGTYPVKLQGAEQTIRDIFDRLDRIKSEMLNVAPLTAGLAALTGEVEFFSSGRNNRKGGRSKFEDLVFQRLVARQDLAGALGVPYLGNMKTAGQSSFEVY